MDLLLSTSVLSFVTIAYGTMTGLTLFNDQYQLQDLNKLFVTDERKNRYKDYNDANFTVAVTVLIACIFLFIFVSLGSNINKSIFYVFSFFFLILPAIYYVIIGFLMFKMPRLNNSNKISTQALLNWSYALILFIYSIVIILQGKGYQKSSSSGSTKSEAAVSSASS